MDQISTLLQATFFEKGTKMALKHNLSDDLDFRPRIYSKEQNRWYGRKRVFLFCPFEEPSSRKNATNEISFESPNTELSEFIKKLGVASSWRWPRPIY